MRFIAFWGPDVAIQEQTEQILRMKARAFLLGIMLSLAFLASQANIGLTAEPKKEKAPEFVLTTFNNKNISLSDFQGRPVVIKFIASW